MNFKKLVKTGALFTLIAGITVTYVSKNDEIKAGIDNLKGQVISQFNGKKEAQRKLAEVQGKLDSIVSALGLDNSASIDEILSAINSSKEADLSALAEALGLPAEATQEEIIAEINSLNSEVTELEGQADTLTAKINQLVADLELANSEEASQLAYINDTIAEVEQTVAEEQPPAEDMTSPLTTEQQIANILANLPGVASVTKGSDYITINFDTSNNKSLAKTQLESYEIITNNFELGDGGNSIYLNSKGTTNLTDIVEAYNNR